MTYRKKKKTSPLFKESSLEVGERKIIPVQGNKGTFASLGTTKKTNRRRRGSGHYRRF